MYSLWHLLRYFFKVFLSHIWTWYMTLLCCSCLTPVLRWSVLCFLNRRGKERMQVQSVMEQVAPNATVRVCFASLEKIKEMEDQPLRVQKRAEKTEIWRAWTRALYSSPWEQTIQQKCWTQKSGLIWRLETHLVPPGEVCRPARTTQPKPARLNPVSTQTQDEWWCISCFPLLKLLFEFIQGNRKQAGSLLRQLSCNLAGC